ncbi:calcium-binding protein [Mesorhizobium sp. B2-9-1]|nr:calcium-binding protein [Mesorhizobium sp. B2-9-1]TPJ27942.1 calcium-binding protein [Mesorhizobium sp. B2-7-2]
MNTMTKKPVLVSVGPDFSQSTASVDLNLHTHTVQLEENIPPSATVTNEAAYFAGGTAYTTDFTYTGTWFGSAFSDRMIGDDLTNLFSGGPGNDFLHGGAGADALNGDDGNDFITGGAGDDLLDGGAGNDTINGGADNDTIRGGIDSDVIYGGTGDDTIYGGSGIRPSDGQDHTPGDTNDTLYGGAGNDTIFGNAGDDYIDGGAGNDTLYGDDTATSPTSGNDTIHGGAGDDVVEDSHGTNTLYGDAGNDTILGGDQNDTIYGGRGADIILGGAGADWMSANNGITTGDGARDTFVFFSGDSSATVQDTIQGFKHGEDKIDLHESRHIALILNDASGSSGTFASSQAALDYLHAHNISAEGAVVKVDTGSSGLIVGFSDDAGTIDLNVAVGETAAAHITESDFLFA